MDSPSPRNVRGRIDVHPRGFGFLVFTSASGEELSAFVPPPDLNPLLAGDVVTGTVTVQTDGRQGATGLVLVSRSRERVYGEVVTRKGVFHLRIDREVGNADWPLETGGVDVKHGDAVVARVDAASAPRVLLERKLGPDEDRALEQLIVRHGLVRDFAPDVLQEAQRVQQVPHGLGTRRDLRALPTVTVDAPTTRDIDDAVSILPAGPDGALRLLVSIADASEFVPEGSLLDRSARERGTSAYLHGPVLPMLPEALSTQALSLVQGEDRLCLTVELRIDPEGRVTAADVYESVIRSWARLDYDEVAAYLEHGVLSEAMAPVREAMPWFRAAGARLSVARAARGGIELSRDEGRFTYDEAGTVTGIESARPTPAHLLIERFMVAANEAIAQWLLDRGVPAPFRVQGRPAPEDVAEFAESALHSGFAAGFGRELSPLALGAFDRQLTGTDAEFALRSVMRRMLGRARYSVIPSEHFGLAAPCYLHFTSPIRRYADLAVHRQVKQYLHGKRNFIHEDPEIAALAAHLDARARSAQRAESDRKRVLEARVMAGRLGAICSGRVTRVRPFGLLVQLDGTQVEGLLPADALPGGPYRVDPRATAFVGGQGRYTLGQPLVVKVAAADDKQGRVELSLAG